MTKPEAFRSLASTLLAQRAIDAQEPSFELVAETMEAAQVRANPADLESLVSELRRFHAHLREAVERAFESLLLDIASEVLGRELLLAPCDLQRIVQRTLERYAAELPVRVRVSDADRAVLELGIPVLCDSALMPGDAVVELRDGEIDVALGVRLEQLLESISP